MNPQHPQQPAPPAPMAHGPKSGAPPTPPATATGSPAPQLAPWQQRAQQRAPFFTQVRVEFRKFAGTTSNRILLVVGPLVLIGLAVWITFMWGPLNSSADQIGPAAWATRMAPIVLHAVLIKLIAGEWQHRSAQPTLLVQPSRARYFLAQATVVFSIWLFSAAVLIALTFILTPIAVDPQAGYLLTIRPGWVISVILVGSLMTVMTALIVSMLVPNAAGALAIYFGAVPVLLILSGVAPRIFVWVDPFAPALVLATLAEVDSPAPALTSLALWAGLLALSGWLVSRRDLA